MHLPVLHETMVLVVASCTSCAQKPSSCYLLLIHILLIAVTHRAAVAAIAVGAAAGAGEGADFLLGEVTDTISRVRTEQGLLTYLHCLKALGGAHHLRCLKAITRLRLQSELYSLTSPGAQQQVEERR
jgi:hypothetical protein